MSPGPDEYGTLTDGRSQLASGSNIDTDRVTHAFGDMIARARKGEPVRADDYIAQGEAAALNPEHLMDLVYAEYLARAEAGTAPGVSELASRFPQIADRIHRQLDVHEALESDQPTGTYGAAVDETQAIAPNPEAIGRYRVIAKLGEGGQGVVYRGFHPQLGRDVVIKLARQTVPLAETALRAEARLLAALDHPGIARIHDLDVHCDQPFAVLEFVDGRTLDAVAAVEPILLKQAALWVAEAAAAVGYANRQGVTHRDLKPQNLMLDSRGRIRVIDFGLARVFTPTDGPSADQGAISGTVQFMAPEQARGETDQIGPRADVFGLGGVLYFLLTGVPPYTGGTKLEMLMRATRGEWDRTQLRGPTVPRRLREVCEKALAPDPRERYPTADALAAALRRAVAPPHRRYFVAGIALGALVAVVGGVWAANRKPSEPTPITQPEEGPTPPKVEAPPEQPKFDVRVWNAGQGKYRNAIVALPLTIGERLRYESDAPANRHLTMFAVDSAGAVAVLSTVAPKTTPGRIAYPESVQESSALVAPAGTVVVIVCGRTNSPVTVDEVRAAFGPHPWPQIPPRSLILIEREKVESFGGRGVGPPTAQADPEGDVLRRLDAGRKALYSTCDVLAGVAFSFK